jgi:hypothetical protein
MSAAALEHNRRAVYTALSGVCPDRLLLERAFGYFEDNFAAQAVFRVAQYIDGLMGHVGLNPTQRRALSVALYAALGKQDGDLAQVPAVLRKGIPAGATPAAAATPARKPVTAVSGDAATTVLAAVLRKLVEGGVRSVSPEDFVASLQASCSEFRGSTRTAADDWITGSFTDVERFAARAAPADRRAVINAVYVALCDASGPVAADKILARAVEAAEKLDAAGQCPPRSLL